MRWFKQVVDKKKTKNRPLSIFPVVSKGIGTGRVRCMVTAGHTKEQLDRALEMFKSVGEEMGLV